MVMVTVLCMFCGFFFFSPGPIPSDRSLALKSPQSWENHQDNQDDQAWELAWKSLSYPDSLGVNTRFQSSASCPLAQVHDPGRYLCLSIFSLRIIFHWGSVFKCTEATIFCFGIFLLSLSINSGESWGWILSPSTIVSPKASSYLLWTVLLLGRDVLNDFINCTVQILSWYTIRGWNRPTWHLENMAH